jgi:hypothetical protein
MITYQRFGSYVTAEPFRPFRIQMNGGRTFKIRHPEMISVGRSTAHIFTAMSDDPVPANERQNEVSLLLIESIEPIDAVSRLQGG